MIANELNRAGKWIEKKDFNEVKLCYERAFELLYLTVETLSSQSGPVSRHNELPLVIDGRDNKKLKELLRFKEVLATLYIDNNPSVKQNFDLFKVLVSLSKESFSMLRV
jgi:predicted membrane-bound spermidine synthase